MDGDRLAAIILARTGGIGAVTWHHLLARFGTAHAALEALPDLAQRAGRRGFRIVGKAAVLNEIEAVARLGGAYLIAGDAAYPPLLAETVASPPVLIVKGDLGILERQAVAIVGARNASAAGCHFARLLAYDLGQSGLAVVSGLARGIDTAAHRGALASATIGVIASGLDVYFPPENRGLQEQIAADHLLITEYPPGTEPLARQFPHRNRIIAGATLGTVVVEAAPKSGSLLTARLATEAGRDVMAVPGSPLDPRAQGCNLLIREGATLVQSPADICECLGEGAVPRRPVAPATPKAPTVVAEASAQERDRLIALLGPVAVRIDELSRQSDLPAEMVQSILLELELAGRVAYHAGGRVSYA